MGDLVDLLKKGIGAAALTGALFSSSGCVEFARHFNRAHIETPLPVTDRKTKSEIMNCELVLSGESVKQNYDDGRVRLGGRARCKYNIRSYDEWTERTKYESYHDMANKSSGVWEKKMTEEIKVQGEEFIPSHLSINLTDSGKNIRIPLNSDGSFEKEILVDSFKRLAGLKYYDVLTKPYDLLISEADSSENKPEGSTFEPQVIGHVDQFYYSVNKLRIKEFIDNNVNSKVFEITINARDSNTRVPVGVQSIVVERESLPKIAETIEREFGNDSNLVEIARAYVRYDLDKNARITGSGQSLTFSAFEDVKYSVETIDPAHHYTKSSFVAKKGSDKKSILLVEVGQKLRIDETKEGKGQLIDEK
ncbi:MAG TPA: hypothetical protein VI544_01575 [Candidatus Nanoarchaeia archaeon]|nr:hypothetical protein [Candidatus Nanoarchaeia archaeon]